MPSLAEITPLDHSRNGIPEHCCEPEQHRFHSRPGAALEPGDLIWCCCKSLLTEVNDA